MDLITAGLLCLIGHCATPFTAVWREREEHTYVEITLNLDVSGRLSIIEKMTLDDYVIKVIACPKEDPNRIKKS